ncbi:MAG: zf-TFIIB domain-containing protein, partial [Steroidobacteraceae bacterium]
MNLKCPKCNVDLVPTVRHKITVNYCHSCKGMWLERQELEQLEDEV